MAFMVPDVKMQSFVSELKVHCGLRAQGCCWRGRFDAKLGHEAECPVRLASDAAADAAEKERDISELSTRLEDCKRANTELQTELAQTRSQLETAEASNRALQGELSRLRDMQAWLAASMSSAPPAVLELFSCTSTASSSKGWPVPRAEGIPRQDRGARSSHDDVVSPDGGVRTSGSDWRWEQKEKDEQGWRWEANGWRKANADLGGAPAVAPAAAVPLDADDPGRELPRSPPQESLPRYEEQPSLLLREAAEVLEDDHDEDWLWPQYRAEDYEAKDKLD